MFINKKTVFSQKFLKTLASRRKADVLLRRNAKFRFDREENFMNNFTNPLNNIKIASPCSADWNAMIGNERQRYCGECKLNVYNLSGMSRNEAETLIMQSEGRVCVRFFRRSDGTVITKDCPVGWQAVKKRLSRFRTAAVSLLFTIFGGIGLTALVSNTSQENNVMGEIAVPYNEPVKPEITDEPALMGAMVYEYDGREEMGKPVIRKDVKDKIIKKYGN